MATKKITKKQSKSDFVRSQPAAMTASEVVAKAKSKGIRLTSQLVYKVRGPKKTAGTSSDGHTALASPSAAAARPVQSKAAFVRSLPRDMPAKEVVAEAKKQGIEILDRYVYWVRSMAKGLAKTTLARQAARRSTEREAPAISRPITTSKTESLLRAVAAEIGLGRAIELLEADRARVAAVLAG